MSFRQNYFREHASCAVVDVGRRARFDRHGALQTRGTGEENVQPGARLKPLRGDDIAAFYVGADFQIRQVDRGACSRPKKIDIPAVSLKRANTSGDALWLNKNRFADAQRSTGERPGHDGADSAQGKCAIDE